MIIREELFLVQDDNYADFQAKLMPSVDRDKIIGVRIPIARKIARKFAADEECKLFINDLPHKYFDEDMIHALVISLDKDFSHCVTEVERFLPYIDNWAVCDTLFPVCFKNNKEKLLIYIDRWMKSKETYTCRFGIKMLMSLYLDDDFNEDLLKGPASIISEEYYVNMMIAWFFATALAKQWDTSIIYIENHKLPVWVHNKTIQKARESFRISLEQKEYLKMLRR